MRNKFLKLTALSLLTASMSCMSFAESAMDCAEARASLDNALNEAHLENKFLNIKSSNTVLNGSCAASFIYNVDTEKEMDELHLSFIKYLNNEKGTKLTFARQYTKL